MKANEGEGSKSESKRLRFQFDLDLADAVDNKVRYSLTVPTVPLIVPNPMVPEEQDWTVLYIEVNFCTQATEVA